MGKFPKRRGIMIWPSLLLLGEGTLRFPSNRSYASLVFGKSLGRCWCKSLLSAVYNVHVHVYMYTWANSILSTGTIRWTWPTLSTGRTTSQLSTMRSRKRNRCTSRTSLCLSNLKHTHHVMHDIHTIHDLIEKGKNGSAWQLCDDEMGGRGDRYSTWEQVSSSSFLQPTTYNIYNKNTTYNIHNIIYNHQHTSIAVILASLHLVKLRLSNLYKKPSSTKKISLVILLMCHKLPQKYSSYISS